MRPLVDVADDGAGEHDGRGGPHRLHGPGGDQHLRRGGQRAERAAAAVEREPGQRRRLAAVLVGDRPVDDLPDGEGEQIDGQR